MAGKEINIVREYLKAFSSGNTAVYKELLCEDAAAEYSSLGTYRGIEDISEHVRITEPFDDYTVTMLNTLSYHDEGNIILSTIAQHMHYYEDTPYLYPVVYGGQYVFVIDEETLKIRRIVFQLDYQGENTWYLHDWNLTDGHNSCDRIRSVYSSAKQYDAIMAADSSDSEKAIALARLYLTAWNIRDLSFLSFINTSDCVYSREKTYSNGKLTGSAQDTEDYLKQVEDYYDLNEWGARINGAEKTENGYKAEFQLLSPYRLNTKKLTSANKFSSFYDEAGTIVFNSDWKVTSFDSYKLADIYMNGFDVLEV